MPSGIQKYNREMTVAYAHRWARSRNPAYYDYENIGGDCTNFASQCVFAGAGVMNYAQLYGWYYRGANDKSPSWTGVSYLYDFLTGSGGGPGPFGAEVSAGEVEPGDLVQLAFDNGPFGHTPVIVAVGPVPDTGSILTASHTPNTENLPVGAWDYTAIRFIHILGVRR